jgi:hypothetical protein
MKVFIIFFLLLGTLAVFGDTRKIEGEVCIEDETGKKYPTKNMPRPNFCVDLYYSEEAGEDFPCPGSFDVTDNWKFTVIIRGRCNHPESYEKRMCLKPNFDRNPPPAGWEMKKPPPYIILRESQTSYRPNKPLVIQIPSRLSLKDRQKNLKLGKQVFKKLPEEEKFLSLIYFYEAARGENDEYNFSMLAGNFLKKNDYPELANKIFKKKDILKKKDIPEDKDRPYFPPDLYALSAQICGVVTLEDGAAIPGVVVEITGQNLVGKRTMVTSETGAYRFTNLPPGEYDISLALEGFQTVQRKGIRLSVGKTVTFDIVMSTGGLSKEIIIYNP